MLSGFLFCNRKFVDSTDIRCKEFKNGKLLVFIVFGLSIYKYFERRMCVCIVFIFNECFEFWGRYFMSS